MSNGSPDLFDQSDRLPPHLIEEYERANHLSLTDTLHLGARLEYLRRTGSNRLEITEGKVAKILEEIVRILNDREINSRLPGLITRRLLSDLELESDDILSEDQLENLETQTSSWIHLLARELNEERRIPATDTGVLDVSKLSESPEDLFQESVWQWLDERPRSDLQEACKTITVGCSTSSVMLSLRAVEHCLRKWYEQQDETLDAAWGRVLDQLMEEYAEENKKNDTVLTQLSDLPPVLSTLYYLKEKRNEVNHPEKSPTPREARRTLMIVSSTITEIHREMRSEAAQEAENEIVQQSRFEYEDISLSNREEEFLGFLEQVDHNTAGDVDIATVYDKADDWGARKEEVDKIIHDLLMKGHIYEPAENKIRTI